MPTALKRRKSNQGVWTRYKIERHAEQMAQRMGKSVLVSDFQPIALGLIMVGAMLETGAHDALPLVSWPDGTASVWIDRHGRLFRVEERRGLEVATEVQVAASAFTAIGRVVIGWSTCPELWLRVSKIRVAAALELIVKVAA